MCLDETISEFDTDNGATGQLFVFPLSSWQAPNQYYSGKLSSSPTDTWFSLPDDCSQTNSLLLIQEKKYSNTYAIFTINTRGTMGPSDNTVRLRVGLRVREWVMFDSHSPIVQVCRTVSYTGSWITYWFIDLTSVYNHQAVFTFKHTYQTLMSSYVISSTSSLPSTFFSVKGWGYNTKSLLVISLICHNSCFNE